MHTATRLAASGILMGSVAFKKIWGGSKQKLSTFCCGFAPEKNKIGRCILENDNQREDCTKTATDFNRIKSRDSSWCIKQHCGQMRKTKKSIWIGNKNFSKEECVDLGAAVKMGYCFLEKKIN